MTWDMREFHVQSVCWLAAKAYQRSVKSKRSASAKKKPVESYPKLSTVPPAVPTVFRLQDFQAEADKQLDASISESVARALLCSCKEVVQQEDGLFQLHSKDIIAIRCTSMYQDAVILESHFSTTGRVTRISAKDMFAVAEELDRLARYIRNTEVAGAPSGHAYEIILVERV